MNAFMVVVFEFFIFSVVIQIHGAGPTATTGQEVTRADGEGSPRRFVRTGGNFSVPLFLGLC